MNTLLHIIATPRAQASKTLEVSASFLTALHARYPKCVIDTLDLYHERLPDMTRKRVDGKYVLLSGKDLDDEGKAAWREILQHIERFMAADACLISTPMWNFSIPYPLKHYLDVILQPKYLFRYTPTGPEGLVKGKKMVIITSRGGDYSGALQTADFQEPYLRFVFNFVGITDLTFIHAQPTNMGDELQAQKIAEAQKTAQSVASSL